MTASATTEKMSTNTIIKWVIAFIIPIILLLLPPGEILTKEIYIFFSIMLFAILLIAFELTDSLVVGIILFTGYYVSGIAPAATVFAPWASTAVWVTIAVLFMATMLDECGVLRRIAVVSILKIGCSYKRTLWGLWFAALVIGFLTSSQAQYIMPPFCLGVCKALNIKKGRETFGIFMAGGIGAMGAMDIVYNPVLASVMEQACQMVDPSITITYVSFLAHNWPMIGFSFISMFLLQFMYKSEKGFDSSEYFERELEKMGEMRASEKKALILVVVLIGYACVAAFTGLPSANGFMIIPWLAFLPGMNIVKTDAIRKVNYSIAIFVAACLSIGSVGGYLNIGTLLADSVAPYIAGASTNVALLGVYLTALVTNFLLTPLAVLAALAAPISTIVGTLGISPLTTNYLMLANLNQAILPYENAGWLLFYSFGFIKIKDFVKFMSLRMVIHLIYCFIILLPYWRIIGIL